MAQPQPGVSRLPPRWFVRGAWLVDRALYRLTGGRFCLARLRPGLGWKTLRLTTTGRRSGQPRSVLLAHLGDGPNLVMLAMNGWADPDPAWWLNLQANPDAIVEHDGRTRPVRGRAAAGEERERLWARWRDSDQALDSYAGLRSGETAVVVLEPGAGPDPASR
jgi:deazaflavin-dependent oxidoreductase (nitroreductase family)